MKRLLTVVVLTTLAWSVASAQIIGTWVKAVPGDMPGGNTVRVTDGATGGWYDGPADGSGWSWPHYPNWFAYSGDGGLDAAGNGGTSINHYSLNYYGENSAPLATLRTIVTALPNGLYNIYVIFKSMPWASGDAGVKIGLTGGVQTVFTDINATDTGQMAGSLPVFQAFLGQIDVTDGRFSVDVDVHGTSTNKRTYYDGLTYEPTDTPLPETAHNPDPADTALNVSINPALSWDPGASADSHDVYWGTAYDDVDSANTLSPEYKGNLPLASTTFAMPTLAGNTTYYWRVDEVNGQTWKGPVWRFTTRDVGMAHDPSPAHEDIAVPDEEIVLSWQPGQNATGHDLYWGTDYDAVNNAVRLSGDVNGSGKVDADDFFLLLARWLNIPAGDSTFSADLNDDGVVNLKDFAFLTANWQGVGDGVYRGHKTLADNQWRIDELDRPGTYYWRIDETSDTETTKGQVWRFDVGVWYMEIQNYDAWETITMMALQGFANRKQPRLFLYTGEKSWVNDFTVPMIHHSSETLANYRNPEDIWKEYFQQKHGLKFKTLESMDDLINLLAPELNGLLLYRVNVHEQWTAACAMAGAYDLIPTTAGVRAAHPALAALPVMRDISGTYGTTLDFQRGVWDEIKDLCAKDGVYSVAGSDNLISMDLPVADKMFVYYLWYNDPAHPGETELAREIISSLDPMSPVWGWGYPTEHNLWNVVSEEGGFVQCSSASNTSFFARLKPFRENPFQRQHPLPQPESYQLEDKYYVSFMVNEGDTIKIAASLMAYGMWAEPERGDVAINWGVCPQLYEKCPAMMEFYHETMSPKDSFFAATTGYGYFQATTTPHLYPFAQRENQVAGLADLHVGGIWGANALGQPTYYDWLDTRGLDGYIAEVIGSSFVDYTPQLRPVIGVDHWLCYWWHRYSGSEQELYQQVADRIETIASQHAAPYFIPVYGGNPSAFYNIASRLQPAEDFEIVTLDKMIHLARKQALAQLTYEWDDGGGDHLWTTAENWSTDMAPTTNSHCVLDAPRATGAQGPVINADVHARRLLLGDGVSGSVRLTMNSGSLSTLEEGVSIGHTGDSSCVFYMNDGELITQGGWMMAVGYQNATGTIYMSGGKITVDHTAGLRVGYGTWSADETTRGCIYLNGGEIHANDIEFESYYKPGSVLEGKMYIDDDGLLVVTGDKTTKLDNYINSGNIVYNGNTPGAALQVEYPIDGDTVVSVHIPPP